MADSEDAPTNAPTPETHDGREGDAPPDGGEAPGEGAGPEGEDSAPEPPDDGETDRTDPRSAMERLRGGVEAILFAVDDPVSRSALEAALAPDESEKLDRALEQLKVEYGGPARGVHLERVAEGWALRTNPDFGDVVRELVEREPVELSRAALETLAIVAYRQPITRAEVEEIRGVDSSGVLGTLEECELIRVIGRLDDMGRPYVYGTTDRFLEYFGLEELTDLPTLSEDEHESLDELYEDELAQFDDEYD
ncbi:MAG: SMC-Scp complex subunit ScpB [Bradymonadaceae bacterium]